MGKHSTEVETVSALEEFLSALDSKDVLEAVESAIDDYMPSYGDETIPFSSSLANAAVYAAIRTLRERLS